MGRVVWPGEPFLKKWRNIKKRNLFSKYACPFFQEQVPKMSFSPLSHRQPLAMGSSRGRAPRNCRAGLGEVQPPSRMIYLYSYTVISFYNISRYTGYSRMGGPSVLPDSSTEGLARGRVFRILGPIPECLVLQYFQIQILKD